jgi:hypothetical protein
MSFQNMPDLGYKDDGPLGAFFAGIQGGNANTASQLANAAAYEKLQQDQFNNPLESIGKIFDAKEAQGKLDDPNYLPWKRAGYVGQMMSQDAAGRKAQALSADEIAYEKQRLANGLLSGKLDQKTYEEQMRMINELLAGGGQQPSAPIGFAMTPSPEYRKEDYGNEGRGLTPLPILKTEGDMKRSMGTDYRTGDMPYDLETLDKEIKQFGDPTGELGKERTRLVASLAAGGGGGETPNQQVGIAPVFSNMSSGGLGNKPTPYSDLIPKQSVLAKMAGIRTLDPKFVGDMTKLETKVDSAEDIAAKRAEIQAAAAKKELKDPKYNEQLAAAFRTRASATATEQEKYEANMFIWLDQQRRFVANPSAYNPRMDMGQMGMPMMPTPVAQGRAQEPTPPSGTPQTPQGKSDPLGIR